jgi:hypothetical protein
MHDTLAALEPLGSASPFAGEHAALLTKHGKERAILPVLWERLGLWTELFIADTDRFGTFTEEIPRIGSQLDALRAKLEAARELARHRSIFVASEGAFFPHPHFPFLTVDRELVGLYDRRGDVEIVGCAVSTDTNAASVEVKSEDDLRAALARIRFPSHAAVLRCGDAIEKGLRDEEAVLRLARERWARGESPILESDMRAHCNPARMAVIAKAAENLAARALSTCPACRRPGYWPDEIVPGMPCSDCGAPTEKALAQRWRCGGCAFEQDRPLGGRADPGDCAACNP